MLQERKMLRLLQSDEDHDAAYRNNFTQAGSEKPIQRLLRLGSNEYEGHEPFLHDERMKWDHWKETISQVRRFGAGILWLLLVRGLVYRVLRRRR